jgi:hypothetical protein
MNDNHITEKGEVKYTASIKIRCIYLDIKIENADITEMLIKVDNSKKGPIPKIPVSVL